MKHASWIICDNLVSIRKSDLRDFVASLSPPKVTELDHALRVALALEQGPAIIQRFANR